MALVTGAASGIGEAAARLFAERGARVALIDLDEAGEAVQFIEYAVQAFKLGIWRAPRFRGSV